MPSVLLQLAEQIGRDGEQIAAGQLDDLADVAEARAHDLGLVVEFLEIIVDCVDGVDAGVLGGRDLFDSASFTYQSWIRPTNGEISVTLASAQATAWAKLKSSVRLQ